jgi:dihydrofolate reductase
MLVDSLEKAFDSIPPSTPRTFVIGGAQMYKMAIQHANCTHILLTRIRSKVECDTFFPDINEDHYRLASHEELEAYVGDAVAKGVQKHKEYEYEFTLYLRK